MKNWDREENGFSWTVISYNDFHIDLKHTSKEILIEYLVNINIIALQFVHDNLADYDFSITGKNVKTLTNSLVL